MRSAMVSVAASEVPSGALTVTWNSLRSSIGEKILAHHHEKRNGGQSETATHSATMILRCAMAHSSIRV